jgi:hypothetical protein
MKGGCITVPLWSLLLASFFAPRGWTAEGLQGHGYQSPLLVAFSQQFPEPEKHWQIPS